MALFSVIAVNSEHVPFFIICAKLNNGIHDSFNTSLPLNSYTSVSGCVRGFGFEQNFSESTDLGKKRH